MLFKFICWLRNLLNKHISRIFLARIKSIMMGSLLCKQLRVFVMSQSKHNVPFFHRIGFFSML